MSVKLYNINPDRNTPWNDLPPLPINNELYYNTDVLEALVHAKSELSLLQGRSIAIPDQAILINSISIQEARDSSAIENIFTTDDELYRAFSEENPDAVRGPEKEVLRYREALWRGYDLLKKKSQFDIEYLISVFQEIKQTKDGIRPPFLPTVILQGGSGPNAGQVIYTPPRGKGILEEKLSNLLEFINRDDDFQIDPLIKLAIGHFQFEAIHPFRDGNGRAGRIFNIHILTKKGLLEYPILYLSKYIIDNKNDYYRLLQNVSQKGQWKEWIIFMLKAIQVTSKLTYTKINQIIDIKDIILDELIKNKDIRRPESLVESIFIQPYTRVKHLTEKEIYSENTARSYLNKLSEMGILEKKSIYGHHYYLNLELMRILSE
ncbi:MAG: Fic family protein [Bacteroidales bacterium]|nr:Fic family protein [Bacteroidales bacterium]MCF8399555.1 Fic family protein [Bacteroidales bacterium]